MVKVVEVVTELGKKEEETEKMEEGGKRDGVQERLRRVGGAGEVEGWERWRGRGV